MNFDMVNKKMNNVASIPGLFREYAQTTSKLAKETLLECAATQAKEEGNIHAVLIAGLRFKEMGKTEKSKELLCYAADKGDDFALILLDELCE